MIRQMALLARVGQTSLRLCTRICLPHINKLASTPIYLSSRQYSTSKPPTEPHQLTPELLQKYTEEGTKLKTCLEKEIKNLKQAKHDHDLIEDYLKLYQFQISPTNPNLLTKTVDNEEITIDIEPTHSDNLLCQDLPEFGEFQVQIKKNNTLLTFSCQYDCNSTGETYTIKEMRVKESTDKGIGLKTSNLEDATTSIFTSFLYSRVPPSTPQVIDTFLNIRGDKEYLQFLSSAAKLFDTAKPS